MRGWPLIAKSPPAENHGFLAFPIIVLFPSSALMVGTELSRLCGGIYGCHCRVDPMP
jgi:hypothetical protein